MEMDLAELMEIEVTTASLHSAPLHKSPGTVIAITRAQMRDRGYRNLADLLADLPGVDLLNYTDGTTFNRIALRGVTGNNKFLILQDGVRISSPTGEPIPVLDNFPLYHARQVEVVFGPASALYGADAFTGVINIITRAPGEVNGSEVVMEGGEFGHRYLSLYSAHEAENGVGWSLGGHLQEADNPDLSRYYPDVFANSRSAYEQPTSTYSVNGKLVLGDLRLGFNRSRAKVPTSVDARPHVVDYAAEAAYYTELQTLHGEYRKPLGETLTGELRVDYSTYEVDPRSQFVNQYTNFERIGYKYAEGRRTRIEPRLDWGLGRHRLIVGASYEDVDALPKTANLPHPYDEGGPFYYPNTSDLPIEIFEADYTNRGLFLQATSDWTDQLTTTVGARWDDNSVYGSSFTPRVGLSYRSSDRTTWKAMYGEAFLAPSPFYRFENYGSFSEPNLAGYFHVPNPDLEPEELKSLELGVTHRATPALTLSMVAYSLEVDDMILRTATATPESDFVPGGTIFYTTHNENVGSLTASGLDLSFDYTTRLKAGDRLALWGNASYVDGELERLGATSELPYVSAYKAKLGATYTWRERYVLSPVARWVGKARGEEGGPEVPSYAVVDLYGELREVMPGLNLFVRVNNLLDRRYYNAGEGGNGFDSSPQDPRWIQIGLRAEF